MQRPRGVRAPTRCRMRGRGEMLRLARGPGSPGLHPPLPIDPPRTRDKETQTDQGPSATLAAMVFFKGRNHPMSYSQVTHVLNSNNIYPISIFDCGHNKVRMVQECLTYLECPSILTDSIIASGTQGLIFPYKNRPGSINFRIEQSKFRH